MCGIAGLVSLDNQPIDPDLLDRMAAALQHRGPDDRRSWIDPVTHLVGLSHTRLSVLDREGGRQPMVDMARPSRRIVFNGEIYNHHQLRRQLISHGHRFASHHSDTEVLLPLYAEHGERFLQHLRGMFALALYDGQDRRLILARDRMGQKPLYWTRTARHLAFASELKALMILPGISRQIDLRAIDLYLTLGYVPAPMTIFCGINKLPPATILSLPVGPGSAGAVEGPRSYWHLPDPLPAEQLHHQGGRADQAGSAHNAEEQLRRTMAEAVALRMEADVPLGFFLSGGLDSSIVLALARQAAPDRRLQTFTMSFGQRDYDESSWAAIMARHVDADHTVLSVEPGQLDELLPAVCHAADEPLADASAVPTWLLAQATRQHVTVALSGDGGDELFGGYDRYRAARLAAWLDRLGPGRGLAAAVAGALGGTGELKSRRARLGRWGRGLKLNPLERYAWFVSPCHEQDSAGIYGQALRSQLAESAASGSAVATHAAPQGSPAPAGLGALGFLAANLPPHLPLLDALLRLDARTYLPEDVLVKVDRMSMAHGLEVRSPMLDHEVVQCAMRLPARTKMGFWPTGRGKMLLRRLFAPLLPRPILRRKDKMGFGLPVSAMLAGSAADLMRSRLGADSPLARSGLVDLPTMLAYVEAHTSRRAEHGPRLWSLLVLDEFLRTHDHRIDF